MKKALSKIRNSKLGKIYMTCGIVGVLGAMFSVMASATDPAPDDATTITTGITTLFNQVATNWSFTNLVTFLGIALGTCAVIALGYFGLRKVLSMIQSALKKGRIKV